MNYKEIFSNPESKATILHLAFLKLYGTEAYEYEPETWYRDIQDDIGVELPDNNKDKLHAMIMTLTTDHFYNQFEVFEKVCWALNDEDPNFASVVPLLPEEMAWGCIEISMADEPILSHTQVPLFSEDVKRYAREVLRANGFYKCPKVLHRVCAEGLPVPEKESEEMETEQKLKHLRLKSYLRLQEENLKKQLHQYFPRSKSVSLPTFSYQRGDFLKSEPTATSFRE